MMGRVIPWSAEEEAWLRETYPHHPNAALPGMHSERFPDRPRRTVNAIHARGNKLGLLKTSECKCKPKFWTPERVEWFKAYVPGHHEAEISAEHERVFGFPLTVGQISNAKSKLGIRSGTDGGQFRRGMTPHNKGRSWDEQGIPPEVQAKMRETGFKKGTVQDRPDGWIKPVGFERVSKDGYIEVKVRDSLIDGIQPNVPGSFNSNYRMKHHVVWEEHNGPIPPSTMIVFADHDKRNFDPDNLVAVPRKLWAVISKGSIPFWDKESLETAMNVARLKNTRSEVMKRPRPCTKCGCEFKPRFAKQRKCDKCIEIYGTGRK